MTPILYIPSETRQTSGVETGLREQPMYEVLTTNTASEVTQILFERPDIECLICPAHLQSIDCFSFIELIRRSHPDLPIVLHPTNGSEELAAKAISAGVTEYLPYSESPGHISELAKTIEAAIDSNWTLLTLRERLKELRGIRKIANLLEDPVTRPLTDILQPVVDAIPESFQYPQSTEARVRIDETAVTTEEFSTSDQMLKVDTVTSDGAKISIEVCYLESKPEADEGPFLAEEYALCRTITSLIKGGIERRHYVEELQKSEALFQEVAENVREVLWVSDPATSEILFVNPSYEEVWGSSRDSLYENSRSFLAAVHPEDRTRVEEAVQDQANGKYEEEYRIIQPSGDIRWVYDRGVPVFDEDGGVYRIVGLAEDITERKMRTQQLAVLYRVLRHNLRNDLNVVSGYSELLSESTDEEVAAYAKVIHTTSERLIRLAEKNREIARQLELSPKFRRIDLSTAMDEIAKELMEFDPNADIVVDAPADTIVTTSAHLKSAVFELARNALEHGDTAHPSIELTVSILDDGVEIRVIDEGPGIAQIETDVLGTEEEQLFHGTGVGLWLVYWIVTNGGGTLEFDSNEPRGSIVTITMPCNFEEA